MKVNTPDNIAKFLIISSYLFGFFCIQMGLLPVLVDYSWFQLLLCAAVLFWFHYTVKEDFIALLKFFIISYFIGYFIEVAGVATGVIFGSYAYGNALGIKALNVPLMIGVNWFLVTFCVNDLVKRWQLSFLKHTFLAALVITSIDVVIEPNAIKLGMWTWEDGVVPIQNYIAWFAVSLVISAVYHRLIHFQNPYAKLIIWCMLLFFGLGLFME